MNEIFKYLKIQDINNIYGSLITKKVKGLQSKFAHIETKHNKTLVSIYF
jgi:hypothetical protein